MNLQGYACLRASYAASYRASICSVATGSALMRSAALPPLFDLEQMQ